jgi:hypothetical protein
MFAFILLVTITLPTADAGPPRSFVFPSADQFSPETCEKRAQEAAHGIAESLSIIEGAKVEIQHTCVRLETRKI